MFEPSEAARVFYLPIGCDFSVGFVDGLKSRLFSKPPHEIAKVKLFVNTRRTERRIRSLFIEQGACFIPQIHLITDLANDPLLMCDLPPQVPSQRRRLQLGQLIRSLLKQEPNLGPLSATYDLADSLNALLDEIQGEGIDIKSVLDLDVGDLSEHWNRSKKFLSILAEHWNQNARVDPQDRMRHVVESYSKAWTESPPEDPIIVVGSTGSRGETALLMQAVSRLPNGAVVLPGIDEEMTNEVQETLLQENAPLDHSMAAISKLLRGLDLNFDDLSLWQEGSVFNEDRNALVSLALRPAPITDQWLSDGPNLQSKLHNATEELQLLEAETSIEEALACSLILREAVENKKKAVLITPSRSLTRRVSANLLRWGIEADDSAGQPLHLSPPGILLRLITASFGRQMSPAALLSLLKHSLVHSEIDRNEHNLLTLRLEKKVLRGGPPFVDFSKIKEWGENSEDDFTKKWAKWICQTCSTLENAKELNLEHWLEIHLNCATKLCAGSNGESSGELWKKTAGEAAQSEFENLQKEAAFGGNLNAIEYSALIKTTLNVEMRSDVQTAHPLISIWGTLEARVQGADLVVLAGLNEGIWPEAPKQDMWLNRDMRKQLGLLLPDRRIGLSAHDFQQATGAPEVIFSRSLREGDAPATASRWLIRLTNLLKGLPPEGKSALLEMRRRGDHWIKLARRLDRPKQKIPLSTRPSPVTPENARLTRLSVTQIKRLVCNPYEIYARHILKIKKLDPLGKEADALERGIAIHEVLETFIKTTEDGLPQNARQAFLDVAEDVLQKSVPWPAAQRIWLARLARVAHWFLEEEQKRRESGTLFVREVKGHIDFEDLGFRLVGVADRIDKGTEGYRIYDYKAGNPPNPTAIKRYDKQLQLEALIAQNSGFEGVEAQNVEWMEYIGFSEQKQQPIKIIDGLTEEIWEEFKALITAYNDPRKGFTAHDKIPTNDFPSDYDHLSRKGEWEDSDPPDPRPVP